MTTVNTPLEAYFAALLSGATIVGDRSVETVEIITDNARLPSTRMTKTPHPRKQQRKKRSEGSCAPSSSPSRWETATQIHVPKPCIPTRQVSVEMCVNDDNASNLDDDDATVTDLSSSFSSSSEQYTKGSLETEDSQVLATARWMSDCKLQSASPKCPERRPCLPRTDSYGSLTKQTSLHASPNVIGRWCT
jgi:hypothetical protein